MSVVNLDQDTRAARAFYGAVRAFAERAQPWDAGVRWYETGPDETWDLTLVSQRVYGNRHEALAVMAAAGLCSVDEPLTERRLALPSAGTLLEIKRRTGFESIPEQRSGFAPVWAET